MDKAQALTATPCNSEYGHDVDDPAEPYMVSGGVFHYHSMCWNCGAYIEWSRDESETAVTDTMPAHELRDYRRRYLAGEPTTIHDVQFHRNYGAVSYVARDETQQVAAWRCALEAATVERRAVRAGLRVIWEGYADAWRCIALPADDNNVIGYVGDVDLGPDAHPDTSPHARAVEVEAAREAFEYLTRNDRITVRCPHSGTATSAADETDDEVSWL